MKTMLVNTILDKLDVYFEHCADFGPAALMAADAILESEEFGKIRKALESAQDVVDATFAHDEDGERIDEQGEHSAADIVQMLCNLEPVLEEAIEVIEPETSLIICGRPIQYDKSGVGHCWVAATDVDCPLDIQEEIAGEIIDGGAEECANFTASNGVNYRW